jgi:hypothetical protein
MIQTPSGTLAERYEHGTRLRKKASREKQRNPPVLINIRR